MEWIIQLPVLLFSVVMHEFCHGWMAYRHGDTTAEKLGRLTLNPAAHLDPFGSIFLPLFCFFTHVPMFGWARPVPVNQSRLKKSSDIVSVALAGPAANLTIVLGAALLYKLAAWASFVPADLKETALQMARFTVAINLFLAFFNLIPIYPLDGSQIASGLLPKNLKRIYARHIPYGVFLILLLLFTKASEAFVSWPSQAVLFWLAKIGLLS